MIHKLPLVVLTSLLVLCSASVPAQPAQDEAAAGPALSPTAPDTYTVKQGDTLWDLSKLFLRDPWAWPEIWYVNPQVENPHLIYPGDVLTLTRGADGKPRLTLQRGNRVRLSPELRSQPLTGAITAIPFDIIAAFMSKPTVLEKAQIKAAPYVITSRDQHLVSSNGDTIYARGGSIGAAPVNSRHAIVNVAGPLKDPEDGKVVGYQADYTSTARLTRSGDPATLELLESERETQDGDKLIPIEPNTGIDFVPHAPAQDLAGQIIYLVNGISMTGQYQVVIINRGKQHGLEPGHVLGIYQIGEKVHDATRDSKIARTFSKKIRLPDERTGTFMVFKTYERISYGLVMEAQSPIHLLDRVSNP